MACKYYNFFFRNLSSPLRVKIIETLKKSPMPVLELSKKINEEQSKVSHALSNLRACQIVQVTQKDKQRIYSLNKETILPILEILDKHRNKFCNNKCNQK